MDPYLDALMAMSALLGFLHEKHWQAWIEQDIQDFNSGRSAKHHLDAYGGMGSFNDLGFADPFQASLFGGVQSACFYLAQHPTVRLSDDAPWAPLLAENRELSGWRCLACGNAQIAARNIADFRASRIVPPLVQAAVRAAELRHLVESFIKAPPVDLAPTEAEVGEWISQSGLHVCATQDWQQLCPRCRSVEIAVYHWVLQTPKSRIFVPAESNLPLHPSAS